MIGFDNIYLVYRVHPAEDGQIHRVLVGKFLLTPDHFQVLEDHVGWLSRLEKLPPAEVARRIHSLSESMYYQVMNLEDVRQGQHPDVLPQVQAGGQEAPESTFSYHREGMASPQTLEFVQGKPYLDGHPLSDEELALILDNVQRGSATLSYKLGEDPVQKAEAAFMSLEKIEPQLEVALNSLRTAAKTGQIDPQHLKTITSHIFGDSMVKRMGNKTAYADFLARPKQGVHIRMDGNDFGQINKQHGFETGNGAITAMGNAIREALDETVGTKHGKSFRIGGDEFHAFVPTHEHAAMFARAVRNKLEKVPPVGGTHNLSLSMGFGHTPEHAELGLINAKGVKRGMGYEPGQAKTHANSQVPGFEGHIPTGPDQLNLKPLPPPAPKPVPVQVVNAPQEPSTAPGTPQPVAAKPGPR